jgi:hypothetical protein
MIPDNTKTSLLIPYQLPAYIRDDPAYANFVLFLQAYYEWMEQEGQVTNRAKNILNYTDIDNTTNEFIDYFINDFLPFFPKDILIDKARAVKYAKQFYQAKGTPASYKFLFKILYNSDFDVFYTKESVLRASAGTWYIAKSLKLASLDDNLLNIKQYRLIGENSKAIATIENSVVSGNKTEVFLSNIQRLFESGEFVRVVDANDQDVLFDGQPLRAKIVGQISSIVINPTARGLYYQPGDPVVVYGGLNEDVPFPIGANAEVETVTTGQIQSINVIDGGFGYSLESPIIITPDNGAIASVASIDPTKASQILIANNAIATKSGIQIGVANYGFKSYTTNLYSTIYNSLDFETVSVAPISSVLVINGGGGFSAPPQITTKALYLTNNYDPVVANNYSDLKFLGILGPMAIENGGIGYQANDKIVFSGGSGYGAYANVITVSANGAITNVAYVYGEQLYPQGGLGYKLTALPTLTIESANANAANALITVSGILGDGAQFEANTNSIGAVSKIKLNSNGEDYVATPIISLKVQDIAVSNLSILNIPQKGDIAYQGSNVDVASYSSTVESISLLAPDVNPANTLYNLRVFNYSGRLNTNEKIKVGSTDRNINLKMANVAYGGLYNSSGIKTYGDGRARANTRFLNGLVFSQGQYLDKKGQLSSFDVLQSENFNNYTYQITVEKEIAKYRETLLGLLHPAGMKVLGRYALRANSNFNITEETLLFTGRPIINYTGELSLATVTTDFDTTSNNMVVFSDLVGANIAEFIFSTGDNFSVKSNSIVELTPTNGPNVRSEVIHVDYTSNTVYLKDNVLLTYANVAFVSGNVNSNTINIEALTGSYDFVNSGNYSNTQNKLEDIVFTGDTIRIGNANNDTFVVSSVNYANGVISLDGTLTANANNVLLAVNRTLSTRAIRIFGPVGIQFYPELTTEDGRSLITEDERLILLG